MGTEQVRRGLALSAALICSLLAFSSPAWATLAALTGGESSVWFVEDARITDTGAPTTGTCTSGANGSGASLLDAGIPGQPDAFDCAAMTWVDGTQVGGALSATSNEATFAPVTISGLRAQVKMRALSSQSTLRTVLALSNPTGSTITVPVEYAGNFGSDSLTAIFDSSSGDTSFTTADRWVITDDSPTGGDPANTTVLYGPDSPPVTPSTVGQTVFTAAGTQGVHGRFEVSIPAGETRRFMFFQQLNPSSTDASRDAAQFDATLRAGSPLTEGLTAAELRTIVNWDFQNSGPDAATTSTGPTRTEP